MRSSYVIAALLIGALSVACAIPRSPDSIESRCAQGFDMVEASACGPGKNTAYLRLQLEEMQTQCKDPESVARVQKIKSTCIPAQETALREAKNDRRKIRAQYVTQVSELLVDPAYGPLVDRYKDLQEQAFHGDGGAKREAQRTLAELAELAGRHGIDPSHGKELQLW